MNFENWNCPSTQRRNRLNKTKNSDHIFVKTQVPVQDRIKPLGSISSNNYGGPLKLFLLGLPPAAERENWRSKPRMPGWELRSWPGYFPCSQIFKLGINHYERRVSCVFQQWPNWSLFAQFDFTFFTHNHTQSDWVKTTNNNYSFSHIGLFLELQWQLTKKFL